MDGGRLLTGFGFVMLSANSVLAIYRAKGDTGSVAFVVVAYFTLVLLFLCLRLFERAARNAARRARLKAAVWSLSTLLTVMFSYKVAALMPFPVDLIVWGMATAVTLGSFFVFFIYEDRP